MNFEIDNDYIEDSFDRIAKELLSQKALFVNGKIIRFTEIEFYYFHQGIHEDNYTHKHKRKSGEWRSHKQGLDITLHGDEKTDGGILIRGILVDGEYTNGPIKSLAKIFECIGSVINTSSIEIKDVNFKNIEIIKTFRHLPNKIQYQEFHDKKYRYISDLKIIKDIPEKIKQEINNNMSKI